MAMEIYSDFAQDEHGKYFTRADIYNNDGHRFYWDAAGDIRPVAKVAYFSDKLSTLA